MREGLGLDTASLDAASPRITAEVPFASHAAQAMLADESDELAVADWEQGPQPMQAEQVP